MMMASTRATREIEKGGRYLHLQEKYMHACLYSVAALNLSAKHKDTKPHHYILVMQTL